MLTTTLEVDIITISMYNAESERPKFKPRQPEAKDQAFNKIMFMFLQHIMLSKAFTHIVSTQPTTIPAYSLVRQVKSQSPF